MKKLTLDNLEDLAIGSAILGSGGGGDYYYPQMAARFRMEQYGPVPLISVSDLRDDQLVMPIGFMGAPLVEIEKLPSGREFLTMFEMVEKDLGKKVDAIMPFEIGGANSLTPIEVGAQLGLPIVDADTMGRAFPEAQMSTCNLFNVRCSPGFETDSIGNTTVIYASNATMLEKIGRQVTVAMGSNNAFGLYPLSGAEVKRCALQKTLSKAISIGKVHREAKKKGDDPMKSILALCKGTYIGSGKIVDIDISISKGFQKGLATIQNKQDKMELIFQNEYLLAKLNGKIVATTPDILILLEQETGTPITSEFLQFGLKVNLVALPAPGIWTTPAGLALVGPRRFGYEVDYQPFFKGKTTNQVVEIVT